MILTYFYTFLCIENGRLLQRNLCDYLEYKHQAAFLRDMVTLGYQIIERDNDEILFKNENGFLSARDIGSLEHEAHPDTWEAFRHVPNYEPIEVPLLPPSKEFPKIIHQTDSCQHIRQQFLKNVQSLKDENPEWEYRYYSDKGRHDFIYNNFGWDILKIYLKINPRYGAARADLFRYLCMYKCGGVYLDMKSGLKQPLNNIVRDDDDILFSNYIDTESDKPLPKQGEFLNTFGDPLREIPQWFLVCRAGNGIMRHIANQTLANILLYQEDKSFGGIHTVFRITGPNMFTRIAVDKAFTNKHRLISYHDEGFVYCNIESYQRLSDYKEAQTPLVL